MKCVVIGGGAAGMIAAIEAAKNGHSVCLLEHNEKLGKKLYITGKGRCNVTNACTKETFFENVPRNPKFLYSAYAAMSSSDIMEFFEKLGVPLKTERGTRVFPVSDKSSDVLRALTRRMEALSIDVKLRAKVQSIKTKDGAVSGVVVGGETIDADRVILATGGLSYRQTGSTGDGYRMLDELGHTIIEPKGALVPLETEETWPSTLSGLTLKNVVLKAYNGKKCVYEQLGEMLFAHFGVTGPLVLSASSIIADKPEGVKLFIDLKPGLTREQLEKRLLRDLEENKQKSVHNAFHALLPARLLDVVLFQAGITKEAMVPTFTKAMRNKLLDTLKMLPLTVKTARSIDEAIITRGGLSVKEVNPNTLESKLVSGLYIAGEVLDTDAFTGGFNLQIAWSTGKLAGELK